MDIPATLQIGSVEQVRSLPSVAYVDRGRLPEQPGVYFVLDADGEVGYVGEAWISIRRRLSNHSKAKAIGACDGSRIAWVICEDDWLRHGVEVFAIMNLHPSLNSQWKRPRPGRTTPRPPGS